MMKLAQRASHVPERTARLAAVAVAAILMLLAPLACTSELGTTSPPDDSTDTGVDAAVTGDDVDHDDSDDTDQTDPVDAGTGAGQQAVCDQETGGGCSCSWTVDSATYTVTCATAPGADDVSGQKQCMCEVDEDGAGSGFPCSGEKTEAGDYCQVGGCCGFELP